MSRHPRRVAIIGAGMGGLAAALDLACRGVEVIVVERQPAVGGKVRRMRAGDHGVEAGPRVIHLLDVFEALFDDAGASLADAVTLAPVPLLARHLWSDGARLDLAAVPGAARDAIGDFAGSAAAHGFSAMLQRAERIFGVLERPVVRGPRPTARSLVAQTGVARLLGISPFATLWDALGEHFQDARLRQVFARCAMNLGMSPLRAPATLLLIAHVEMRGSWRVLGGTTALIQAIHRLAETKGVRFRLGEQAGAVTVSHGRARGVRLADGEVLESDAIIANIEPAAVASGLLGADAAAALPGWRPRRSFSAYAWAFEAEAGDAPLASTVSVMPPPGEAEFAELSLRHRLPAHSTIHLAAPAREDGNPPLGAEPMLCTIHAPARADVTPPSLPHAQDVIAQRFAQMAACGIKLRPGALDIATPHDFAAMFPGSGGALWGTALQGWASLFERPGAATKLPGLFLAGAGVHPGAGLAMAALSGRHAAAAVMAERI
jgi:1-hydroxycarotenoid 3,4-desaturase